MSSSTSSNTLCMIYISLIMVTSQLTKTVKLTPNTISSLDDISVGVGSGTTVISNLFRIDVNSQYGTDLNIDLGASWGFNPMYRSTIEVFINGNTSNETYNNDGQILFIFNVNDLYFAEMISIDYKELAYTECPTSNTPLINTNITKILQSSTPNRYQRFCNNTIDSTITYKETALWPMFMTITNDPILNTVSYSWGDITNGGATKLSSQYTSSFNTNQGLNIYISGLNEGTDFFIYSIDILYHYIGTQPPTTSIPTTATPTTAIPTTTHPTTSQPTTATPTSVMPTTSAPTTATPTTYNPTIDTTSSTIDIDTTQYIMSSTDTISTTNTLSSTTHSTETHATKPSVSPTWLLPPLEVTVIQPMTTFITTMGSTTIDGDDIANDNRSMNAFGHRLWYIVAASAVVSVCICCMVLYFGLKQIKKHENAMDVKDYKGVQTSMEHKEGADNNVQINVVNKHNYKSSDEVYPNNKFYNNSVDFSTNLSSAVTGDQMETMEACSTKTCASGGHSQTSDDDVLTTSHRTDTFRANTTNSSLHDIDGYRSRYKYNQQYQSGINKHQYYGYNEEQQRSSSISDDLLNTDNHGNYHRQYEIGMVTMSKISEMAPGSKGSNMVHRRNNDSLVMEGDTLNDDYDDEASDQSMDDNMETAGFIDGDYNELEYTDEYYEEDD